MRWATAAVLSVALLGAAFAAGWFLSLTFDEDDERLADARAQLANARGQIDQLEDELETSDDELSSVQQERTQLEEQVKQLSGEESGAGLGLPENVKVVSKGKTIKLEELEATLAGHEVSDVVSDEFDTQRADGQFITVTITVKNRLDTPQSLDPEGHFTLLIDGRTFTPDFDAMNFAGGDQSWLNVGLDDLQVGVAKTGTVTFDVSPEAAGKAERGIVLMRQFSDATGLGFDDTAPSLAMAALKLK